MNVQQLENRLTELGISKHRYCLTGGMPDDKLCLALEESKWVVYYSERGRRPLEEFFDTEEEACEFMLKEFVKLELH